MSAESVKLIRDQAKALNEIARDMIAVIRSLPDEDDQCRLLAINQRIIDQTEVGLSYLTAFVLKH